jgi:DNA modification methylase
MLIKGDARFLPLPDCSVQCVVTSPPYWGLRKYAGEQELVWGGEPAHSWEPQPCEHEWVTSRYYTEQTAATETAEAFSQPGAANKARLKAGRWRETNTCIFCGAWRGAFGLEPTIEMYVTHSVEILREIRRVLRPDGVCFWNIADSYNAHPGQRTEHDKAGYKQVTDRGSCESASRNDTKLKAKDLCLIPARVALAAQADGWWVRSDIIWSKPNPMPESVKDRPTDAYEHILMLTKSARYYWDAEAVKEPQTQESIARRTRARLTPYSPPGQTENTGLNREVEDGASRNLRNVWTFATEPYKGAHFATFPAELVIRCLQASTKPRDLVLDPFSGSGTVGEVAFNMGRRFVLVDLAYHELARERIGGLALQM